ncbi:inositol monophosphatase [Poseidonocella sp. HB161398]|uniref:inositol monophosphatase family protein n=1 Tax=Poseidonocella sp. HB161398 TaxID=2320855 RepID=UPI001107E97D|nr:inositol monophosphatase [Poseidonocella sp. HB161398]
MPLTRDEESFLIDIVREAARQHILPRFRALPEDAISSKTADDDLVTIADQQAEKHIAAALAGGALGEVLVVGEEAVEEDPDLPARIPGAARAVIVDPVDGTWNFAHGLANFGVIVAVTEEGETVFSLLYDPVLDDWILARKGGGTWFCRPDAEPRRLAMPAQPSAATGGFVPLRLFPLDQQPKLAAELMAGSRTYSLGCACHEYRMLAQGNARYALGVKPKPWDHAAGVLAVTEAGGRAGMLDGTPYRPGAVPAGVLLTAQSPALFDEMKARLAWLSEEGAA